MKKKTKAKKPVRAKQVAGKAAYYAQSKRLGFRLLNSGDEALYCELYTDAKTLEHVCAPYSLERAQASFRKALEVTAILPLKQRISVIVERATKKPIGIASLRLIDAEKRRAEGGLLLKPTAHAQRFASECSTALISVAFRRHTIDELTARVAVAHKAAEKLVTNTGYVLIEQIPASAEATARTRWSMSRSYWADQFK